MEEYQNNPKVILSSVLSGLQDRSRDVIVSRFGIGADKHETLESIGQRYGITRERVRQIEADALNTIQKDVGSLTSLHEALERFIQTHGGVMDEETLTREFAKEYFETEEPEKYRGLVALALSVGQQFSYAQANDEFSARWHLSEHALSKQEEESRALVEELKRIGKPVGDEKLALLARALNPGESTHVVKSYLTAAKQAEQNVFGQWGLVNWPEIRPRGVRDKAYLVLKKSEKPLHFRDVAEEINKSGFSNRTALAQTVHNELIKDKRFVLVGRGLYALREWGYKEGTVKDVIHRTLKEKGPMEKDEVVQAVLAERFVQPSTVALNLSSFEKDEHGRYTLA